MAVPSTIPTITFIPSVYEQGKSSTPESELFESELTEQVFIVWDAPPNPQIIVIDETKEYIWYLLGYLVKIIHPDATEEVVYSGLYQDSEGVLNTAQHLAFIPPTPGKYGFRVLAVGEYTIRPKTVAA